MTLREKQSEFTLHIGMLIIFAYKQGFELTFGEFFRTEYQQKEYVKTGKSKTMRSRHLIRLAGDFNFFLDGRLLFSPSLPYASYKDDLLRVKILGDYWESLHDENVWGGDWNKNNVMDETFKDPYHFERVP